MKQLTVKQYAALEQVTPRTVYSWIAKGAIESRKTPGGQRRILIEPPGSCRLSFFDLPAKK